MTDLDQVEIRSDPESQHSVAQQNAEDDMQYYNNSWSCFDYFSYDCFKESTVWILDSARCRFSISFDDIMLWITLFVLFIEEISIMFFHKSSDHAIELALSVCLFLFCFELLIQSWAKSSISSIFPLKYEGYIFSFSFWIDILIIVSLFPDINWIAKSMNMNIDPNNYSNVDFYLIQDGHVIRSIRLVRLVKVFKLYYERRRQYKLHIQQQEYKLITNANNTMNNHSHNNINQQGQEADDNTDFHEQTQSRVGAELSAQTTNRVILIVLAMLCLVPILAYSENDQEYTYLAHLTHQIQLRGNNETLSAIIDELQSNSQLLYLNIIPTYGVLFHDKSAIQNIRSSAILKIIKSTDVSGILYETELWFNLSDVYYNASKFGIILTVFVTIVLLVASFVFTSDAQRLVLDPIERMVKMVETMAKDPLHPLQYNHSQSGQGSGEYETRLLENTIEKITGLLRVGFGEAGAGIISSNLKFDDKKSVIDPLIPGKRVYAIFGFCDIHSFEEINEQLGKDVMTFVNTIAEIVHSNVHNWSGSSNKNLGNAFVVVWRLGDEATLSGISSLHAKGLRKSRISSSSSTKQHSFIDVSSVKKPPMSSLDNSFRGNFSASFMSNNNDGTMRALNEPNSTSKRISETSKSIFGIENTRRSGGSGHSVANRGQQHGKLGSYLQTSSQINSNNNTAAASAAAAASNSNNSGAGAKQSSLSLLSQMSASMINNSSTSLAHNNNNINNNTASNQGTRTRNQLRQDGGFPPSNNYGTNAVSAIPRRVAVDLRRVPGAEIFADKALISYLKIIVEMTRSRLFTYYRYDPRLCKLDDNGVAIEFKVKMGFGLHAGWAIEGAVGSLQKVDATYLSPHVNMAARLESASRQYGVPLLFSQSFFEILSPCAQGFCRKLDTITVKGSEFPTGVYTYDTLQDQTFLPMKKRRKMSAGSVDSYTDRIVIDGLTANDPGYFNSSSDTNDVFEKDVDLLQLRAHVTEEFLTYFKDGQTSYIQGDWSSARVNLEKANELMKTVPGMEGGDGPSVTLLGYMESLDWKTPSDWKGFRHLTNK